MDGNFEGLRKEYSNSVNISWVRNCYTLLAIYQKESYNSVMSKEYQHILEGVLALPKGERFALIQAVLAKMKDEFVDESAAERMPWETDELFAELDRRVEEIRSGKVKAVPGEEVMAKLKQRFASK
jgi:putative addiction module component (TIGR02574 family)